MIARGTRLGRATEGTLQGACSVSSDWVSFDTRHFDDIPDMVEINQLVHQPAVLWFLSKQGNVNNAQWAEHW